MFKLEFQTSCDHFAMQEGSGIIGQAVDEEIHDGFGVFERQNVSNVTHC